MSTNVVVVALCALSLGATCYLVASQSKTGDDRVADLSKKLEAAERRADGVEKLQADVRDLREKLDRRFADLDRRIVAAQAADAASPEATGERAGAMTPATTDAAGKSLEDRIADSVEKRVADRIDSLSRDKERGEDGKWKAPIDELADELKLTDAQKAQAKQIFDRTRDEAFTLLKTQRLDGGSLLDDFAASLKSGVDPGESTRQFFGRIFSEKVPGSDQTYLAEFMAMHKDVEDQLSRQLDAGQMKRLRGLRVDLLDVKTDYDPVGDYIRAKVM